MRTPVTLALLILSALSYSGQEYSQQHATKSGKTIRITETHPAGRSLSNIRIASEGFEHEFDETFTGTDTVKSVFVADLDGNGFDELYVITVSAGSGSYSNVIGIASNKDKSMSMIHFPESEPGDPIFQGYLGHDVFAIENRRLVRIVSNLPHHGHQREADRRDSDDRLWPETGGSNVAAENLAGTTQRLIATGEISRNRNRRKIPRIVIGVAAKRNKNNRQSQFHMGVSPNI